jgi:hypothetical protein
MGCGCKKRRSTARKAMARARFQRNEEIARIEDDYGSKIKEIKEKRGPGINNLKKRVNMQERKKVEVNKWTDEKELSLNKAKQKLNRMERIMKREERIATRKKRMAIRNFIEKNKK